MTPACRISTEGEPDTGIADRSMDCPRGRVVGGSSSINGLIYIRGQHQDFDRWQALGAEGWSFQDVLPYFRSIETYNGAPSQYRGGQGPLHVSDLKNQNDACDDWLDAARAYGLPSNEDFNGESAYGVGRYQLSVRGRWRESAATAFLHPALSRPNLEMQTRAHVTEIVFEGSRAVGSVSARWPESHRPCRRGGDPVRWFGADPAAAADLRDRTRRSAPAARDSRSA